MAVYLILTHGGRFWGASPDLGAAKAFAEEIPGARVIAADRAPGPGDVEPDPEHEAIGVLSADALSAIGATPLAATTDPETFPKLGFEEGGVVKDRVVIPLEGAEYEEHLGYPGARGHGWSPKMIASQHRDDHHRDEHRLWALEGGLGHDHPGFDEGGVVEGPVTATIGEAGPEAVVPLDEGKAEAMAERMAEAAEEAAEEVEEAAEEAEAGGRDEEVIRVLRALADLAEEAAEEAEEAAEEAAEAAEEGETGEVVAAAAEAAAAAEEAVSAEEAAEEIAPQRRGVARAWWGP